MSQPEIALFIIEFSTLAALVLVLKKRGPNHRKGVFDLFGTSGILLSIVFFAIQITKVVAWYWGYA